MHTTLATPRFGLGFRTEHFASLAAAPHCVDWLELLSDNYLGVGGPRRAMLARLRRDLPIALHGVSLGIANDAPPRPDYLARLRELAEFLEPAYVGDHLCWTGIGGRNSHDLLPVARTREVLDLVAERVERVQEALGRRLLLENASAYVAFGAGEASEAEFFRALCQRTGCGMLLDVNNLVVNAHNLREDPRAALDVLRAEDVAYLHVAGHAVLSDVRIDTHGADVCAEVWALFREVARRFPHAHVILERDDAIPPLADLLRELDAARGHWRDAASEVAAPPRGAEIRVRAQATEARAWPALQRDLWRRIVDEPLRSDHAADSVDVGALIDAQRPVAAVRGLRVYSDGYRASMQRALAANFPALARVLSPRDFAALAAAYVAAHPSRSHDYLALGARLADFARGFPFAGDYGVAREAFADLARLEQAQLEAQDAPDEPTLAPEALAALGPDAWPGARFVFARAHRIVWTAHDVLPAVRAVARDESPARPAAVRCTYLVSRRAGVVAVEPLDPAGAVALAALAEGATFGAACEKAGGDDAVHAAVAALGRACALGAVRELARET